MHYTILHVAQVYLDSAALQIWQGGRFCGGIGLAFLSDEHAGSGSTKGLIYLNVVLVQMWEAN